MFLGLADLGRGQQRVEVFEPVVTCVGLWISEDDGVLDVAAAFIGERSMHDVGIVVPDKHRLGIGVAEYVGELRSYEVPVHRHESDA